MPTTKPRVGDVGTALAGRVVDHNGRAIDVSAADALEVVLTRPDGTEVVAAATFDSDGTDGWVVYATRAGDFDAAGYYEAAFYVEVEIDSVAVEFTTMPHRFRVRA